MATEVNKVYKEIEQMFGQVPTWIRELPESAVSGFWGYTRDFHLGETRIPNKYKEFIAVAVSGATRCKYCALFHTEVAKLFGATDEEIAEASTMAGCTMLASTFLNGVQVDYDEFRKQTLEMVEYARQHRPSQAAGVEAGASVHHA